MHIAVPSGRDFVFDMDRIRDNNEGRDGWGIMHELGHNMQRGKVEPREWLQVTCNVYVLYAMKKGTRSRMRNFFAV